MAAQLGQPLDRHLLRQIEAALPDVKPPEHDGRRRGSLGVLDLARQLEALCEQGRGLGPPLLRERDLAEPAKAVGQLPSVVQEARLLYGLQEAAARSSQVVEVEADLRELLKRLD